MALPMKAAMKARKAMKAKRISKIATGKLAKAAVLAGRKFKTSGGLTKEKLMKNRRGKVVSKAASAAAKKRSPHFNSWGKAVVAARKALGVTGFCAINGKSAQGKALYAKIKSLLEA